MNSIATPPGSDSEHNVLTTPKRALPLNLPTPASSGKKAVRRALSGTPSSSVDRLIELVQDSFHTSKLLPGLAITPTDFAVAWARLRSSASKSLLLWIDEKLRCAFTSKSNMHGMQR